MQIRIQITDINLSNFESLLIWAVIFQFKKLISVNYNL